MLMWDRVYVYIDGASKGNPGYSGVGIVIKDPSGNILKRYNKVIGKATNNIAEYTALKYALEVVCKYSKDVVILSDSKLLVNQMRGVYKVRNDGIRRMVDEITSIKDAKGLRVEYKLVERGENREADRLANDALRGRIVAAVDDD